MAVVAEAQLVVLVEPGRLVGQAVPVKAPVVVAEQEPQQVAQQVLRQW
jgi:hypothetical protein